jgi:hypothetical protein
MKKVLHDDKLGFIDLYFNDLYGLETVSEKLKIIHKFDCKKK